MVPNRKKIQITVQEKKQSIIDRLREELVAKMKMGGD